MFAVRIVSTEHHMAAPVRGLDVCHSEFRQSAVSRVPVIRVFGATPAGQKTCLHLHGVFPYLYVPYDGTEPESRYLRQFAASVDKAINVALNRSNSNQQHVYKISIVAALPFYGYYEVEKPFLKIYLYNPLMVKKLADLLIGGAIMNKIYQPFETHIPYDLQMLIDYNLHGMNMINLAAVKFRRPKSQDGQERGNNMNSGSTGSLTPSLKLLQESSQFSSSPCLRRWNCDSIPSEQYIDLDCTSTCELEVDAVAADVLNRLEVTDNIGGNPGLAALWEDERQRRKEMGLDDDLEPPSSPSRGKIPWTDAEAALQDRFSEILEELKPYMQADDNDVSSSFPSTQASLVEDHLSQSLISSQLSHNPSWASQDTVMLSDEDDEAVVCETSILRVVASSQSFRGSPPADVDLDSTQDQHLVDVLADLADDNDSLPLNTQKSATFRERRIDLLEEQDSILSQVSSSLKVKSTNGSSDDDTDERETLEMTQSYKPDDFDLEGMDASWSSSQWVDVGRADEEALPQYDGTGDEKFATTSQRSLPHKKRTFPVHLSDDETTTPVIKNVALNKQTKPLNTPNVDRNSKPIVDLSPTGRSPRASKSKCMAFLKDVTGAVRPYNAQPKKQEDNKEKEKPVVKGGKKEKPVVKGGKKEKPVVKVVENSKSVNKGNEKSPKVKEVVKMNETPTARKRGRPKKVEKNPVELQVNVESKESDVSTEKVSPGNPRTIFNKERLKIIKERKALSSKSEQAEKTASAESVDKISSKAKLSAESAKNEAGNCKKGSDAKDSFRTIKLKRRVVDNKSEKQEISTGVHEEQQEGKQEDVPAGKASQVMEDILAEMDEDGNFTNLKPKENEEHVPSKDFFDPSKSKPASEDRYETHKEESEEELPRPKVTGKTYKRNIKPEVEKKLTRLKAKQDRKEIEELMPAPKHPAPNSPRRGGNSPRLLEEASKNVHDLSDCSNKPSLKESESDSDRPVNYELAKRRGSDSEGSEIDEIQAAQFRKFKVGQHKRTYMKTFRPSDTYEQSDNAKSAEIFVKESPKMSVLSTEDISDDEFKPVVKKRGRPKKAKPALSKKVGNTKRTKQGNTTSNKIVSAKNTETVPYDNNDDLVKTMPESDVNINKPKEKTVEEHKDDPNKEPSNYVESKDGLSKVSSEKQTEEKKCDIEENHAPSDPNTSQSQNEVISLPGNRPDVGKPEDITYDKKSADVRSMTDDPQITMISVQPQEGTEKLCGIKEDLLKKEESTDDSEDEEEEMMSSDPGGNSSVAGGNSTGGSGRLSSSDPQKRLYNRKRNFVGVKVPNPKKKLDMRNAKFCGFECTRIVKEDDEEEEEEPEPQAFAVRAVPVSYKQAQSHRRQAIRKTKQKLVQSGVCRINESFSTSEDESSGTLSSSSKKSGWSRPIAQYTSPSKKIPVSRGKQLPKVKKPSAPARSAFSILESCQNQDVNEPSDEQSQVSENVVGEQMDEEQAYQQLVEHESGTYAIVGDSLYLVQAEGEGNTLQYVGDAVDQSAAVQYVLMEQTDLDMMPPPQPPDGTIQQVCETPEVQRHGDDSDMPHLPHEMEVEPVLETSKSDLLLEDDAHDADHFLGEAPVLDEALVAAAPVEGATTTITRLAPRLQAFVHKTRTGARVLLPSSHKAPVRPSMSASGARVLLPAADRPVLIRPPVDTTDESTSSDSRSPSPDRRKKKLSLEQRNDRRKQRKAREVASKQEAHDAAKKQASLNEEQHKRRKSSSSEKISNEIALIKKQSQSSERKALIECQHSVVDLEKTNKLKKNKGRPKSEEIPQSKKIAESVKSKTKRISALEKDSSMIPFDHEDDMWKTPDKLKAKNSCARSPKSHGSPPYKGVRPPYYNPSSLFWFSCHRKVNYVNGKVSDNPAYVAKVQVYQKDCEEHDMHPIGNERLVMMKENDEDIRELKEQVKREVAHMKREKQAFMVAMEKEENEHEQCVSMAPEQPVSSSKKDNYVKSSASDDEADVSHEDVFPDLSPVGEKKALGSSRYENEIDQCVGDMPSKEDVNCDEKVIEKDLITAGIDTQKSDIIDEDLRDEELVDKKVNEDGDGNEKVIKELSNSGMSDFEKCMLSINHGVDIAKMDFHYSKPKSRKESSSKKSSYTSSSHGSKEGIKIKISRSRISSSETTVKEKKQDLDEEKSGERRSNEEKKINKSDDSSSHYTHTEEEKNLKESRYDESSISKEQKTSCISDKRTCSHDRKYHHRSRTSSEKERGYRSSTSEGHKSHDRKQHSSHDKRKHRTESHSHKESSSSGKDAHKHRHHDKKHRSHSHRRDSDRNRRNSEGKSKHSRSSEDSKREGHNRSDKDRKDSEKEISPKAQFSNENLNSGVEPRLSVDTNTEELKSDISINNNETILSSKVDEVNVPHSLESIKDSQSNLNETVQIQRMEEIQEDKTDCKLQNNDFESSADKAAPHLKLPSDKLTPEKDLEKNETLAQDAKNDTYEVAMETFSCCEEVEKDINVESELVSSEIRLQGETTESANDAHMKMDGGANEEIANTEDQNVNQKKTEIPDINKDDLLDKLAEESKRICETEADDSVFEVQTKVLEAELESLSKDSEPMSCESLKSPCSSDKGQNLIGKIEADSTSKPKPPLSLVAENLDFLQPKQVSKLREKTDRSRSSSKESDRCPGVGYQEVAARAIGDSRSSSRRSSGDQTAIDKGVTEVDFSVLEQWMDTEAATDPLGGDVAATVVHGSEVDRQLHTPPLVLQDNLKEATEQTTMFSESDCGMGSEDGHAKRPHKIQHKKYGLYRTESNRDGNRKDMEDKTDGSLKKKHKSKKSIGNSDSRGLKSKQFDDFDMERIDKTEEDKKGKRKVFEQSDHYRFRSKRVAVDYTPGAFTHVYEVERAKSLSPVDDDILNETVDTQVEMDTFTNSAAKLSTLAIEKLESIKKKELQVVVQKLSEEDIALLSTSPTKQLPKHPLDSCLNESVTLTKDSSTSAPSSPSKSISKKKLSNRLDSAFCKPSPSYHRKRTQNKKFKEKLSALHEATISTLKETHEESISEASSPALNADDSSLDSLIKESTAFDSPQEIDDEFRRDRIHGESSGSGSPYAVRTEVVKLGSLTPQKNPESPLSAPASPFESTCMPLEIHSPKIVPQDATDIIGSRIIGRKLDRPTIKAVNALYDTDRNVFNALTIPNRISLSPGNNNNQSSMPLGVEIDCHHESDVSPFCSPNSDDHRHLSQQTDGMNDVKNTKPREPHRFSFKRSELSIERMRGTTSPKSPSPTRSLSVPKSSSPPRSPSPPASPVAYAVAPQKSGLFGSQSPMFIPNMPLLDDEGPQSPDHIPTNIPVNVPAVIPDAAEFDNEAPASPTSGIGSSNVGPVRIPDDMPPASPSAPGSPDAMSDSDSESSAIVMPLDIQDDDDDGAKSLLSAPDSSENHPSVPHVSSVFPREIPSLTNAGEEYIEAPSSPSLDEDAQSYELVKAVPMEMPASPVADPPLSLKHIALTQNIPTEMPVSPVELNAPISPKPVSDTIGIPIEMPTSPVEYESPSSLKDFAQMQDIPTEMPASPVQRDVSISPKTVSDTIGIPIEMPTSPVECESPSTKDFVPMQDIPTEMPASPVELDASISPKPVSDTIGIPTEMPTSPVECESPSSLEDFGQMQDISTEMPASPVELDAPISLKPVSDTIGIPIEMPTSPVELGSPSSPKDFVQMRDIPTEMPASPVELDAPSSPKLVPQTIGISSEMPASPVELDSPKSPKEFVLTLDLPREIPASPEPDTPLSPNCLALIQAIPIEMPASPVELNAPISPKPVSDTIGIPIEMPTSPVELESASSPKDFAQMQDMPTEVPASPVELDAPSSPGPASHVIDIPTDIPASTEIPLSPDYLQSAQEDKSYPSQPVKKIALDIPSSPGMPHSPDSVSPIFSNKFAKSIPMDMPMSPDSCPSSLADDDPFDDVPVTKCIPTDIHDEAPNSPEQDAIRTESVNKMKSIPTDIPGSPEETPTSPKYDDYVAPSIPVDITKCPDAPKSPEAPLSPERHMQSSDFIKGIPTEIPDAPTDSNVDSNAHSIQTLPAKKNSPSGTPGNCISKTDLSHMKNGNSGGKRKRPFSTQMVERIPKKPGRIIIKRLKLSLSLEDKDSSQTVSNVANQQSNAVATPTSPTAVDTPASPTAMDTPASPIRMDTPASPNAEDVKEIKPPVNISIDQETETNETSQIDTRKIKIHRRNRIKIARPKTVIEESPCSPPPHDGPASPDVKGHRFDPVIPKIVPDCPTSQVEASNADANVTKFKAATGDSFDKSKSTSSKSLLDSSSLKQKSGRFSERNYRKPYSSMSKKNRDGQYFSSNQKTDRSGSNLYEAGRTPPRRHLVLQDVVRSRLFEDSGAKCSHPQDAPEKPR